MRLIALLITLLIIGLLIYKQMEPDAIQSEGVNAIPDSSTPKIPTNPESVKKFDVEMNEYMKEEAEKRDKAIDAASQ